MPRLLVSNLELERVSEAYSLIRHLAGIDLEQWDDFYRQLIRLGGGVLSVRGEDECIHGLAAYLPVASLKYGKALRVDAIAAVEFGHSMTVRQALCSALDNVARKKDCGAVIISLDANGVSGRRSRRWRGWEALGLSAATIDFVRHLDGGAPAGSRSEKAED
jgi:hypothetical protein